MHLLFRHTFPPDAWLELRAESETPDARIEVERIVELVDRCPLVFTFPSPFALEEVFDEGLGIEPADDFFVGVEPVIKRLTIDSAETGSLVAVEFTVFSESAIYRADTRTLYVCAPLRRHNRQ